MPPIEETYRMAISSSPFMLLGGIPSDERISLLRPLLAAEENKADFDGRGLLLSAEALWKSSSLLWNGFLFAYKSVLLERCRFADGIINFIFEGAWNDCIRNTHVASSRSKTCTCPTIALRLLTILWESLLYFLHQSGSIHNRANAIVQLCLASWELRVATASIDGLMQCTVGSIHSTLLNIHRMAWHRRDKNLNLDRISWILIRILFELQRS